MLYQDPTQPKKEFTPSPFIAFLIVVAGILGSFQVYDATRIPLEDHHQGEGVSSFQSISTSTSN